MDRRAALEVVLETSFISDSRLGGDIVRKRSYKEKEKYRETRYIDNVEEERKQERVGDAKWDGEDATRLN